MGILNNQALGLPQAGMTLSSLLTGYTVGSNTPVVASDTLIGAIGKLQAQIAAGGGGGGSVTLTDDTATNATYYPVLGTATTGNLSARVSSSKLSFNPSTGILSATGFSAPRGGLSLGTNDLTLCSNGNVAVGGNGWAGLAKLQVVGDIYSDGAWGWFVQGEGGARLAAYRNGADFLTIRNYNQVYTIQQIWSPPGPLGNNGNGQEATLALVRGDEPNQEFIDIYNNGYSYETQFGVRIQKRGTGIYRDFVFDQYDGVGGKIPILSLKASTNVLVGTLTDDGENKLQVAGSIGVTGGVQLQAGAPGVTTNRLYNVGGTLYFNGAAVGTGGSSFTSVDDTTTDASYYPVVVTEAGGSTAKTSSSKFMFNPLKGMLNINGGQSGAHIDIAGDTNGYTGLRIRHINAAQNAFAAFVTGDSFLRFTFQAGGTLGWGPGTTGSDTTLARTGVGALTLTGALTVTGNISPNTLTVTANASANAFRATASGAAGFIGNWAGANYWGCGGLTAHNVRFGMTDSAGSFLAAPTDATFQFDGKLNLFASSTTQATLNIPNGTAPTTPVTGDLWAAGGSLLFYNGASTINLSNKENALGNPPADGYTLVSTAAGVRSWAAPGAAGAGGSNNQVQYNNGGVLSGNAAFTFDAVTNTLYRTGTNPTNNMAISTTEPGPAPTDTLTWYAKRVAGCVVPKFIGPSGGNTPFQAAMWQNRIILWSPGTSTTPNSIGQTATVAATVSHPAPTTGALGTVMYRTQFTTSTTAGTSSGARSIVGVVLIGNASNPGGFFFVARFNQGSLHTNGVQKMVGLSSNTTALSGEPSSTMADFIGMSLDSTDTTWQFTRRTGSAAATKVDLGVTPAANQVFELIMFVKPGTSELFVRIQQFANDGTATTLLDTSYTTSIPAATTFLGMHCQVRNGTLAAAHNIAFAKMYLESAF
jgi:hypothetical protein